MINWEKWNEKIVKEKHGDLYFYRDLYEGKHSKLFPRAQKLIENGDVIDVIERGKADAKNVQTPYIVANVSKLVPEIPATLISRTIGKITTSLDNDEELNDGAAEETDELIDGPEGQDYNSEIINLQQELIDQITENTELPYQHWGNIVQNQVDGGLVGVPRLDENGTIRIEFKSRDTYFPHDDGQGVDLPFMRDINGEKYLHVYRERAERGDLYTTNLLYKTKESGDQLTPIEDDGLVAELLGIDPVEVNQVFRGRSRPLIEYWPNQRTFMNPLGVSSLINQEGKQEEINWTLTRNALTYERNGKPRIAVSRSVFQELQNKSFERYGREDIIDHRDLEITTFDEKGKALEIIQIDIDKIGNIAWVKDLIKLLLIETQTSEKAIDFYMQGSTTSAESGVAKFYDLFVSLVKAEQIRSEYVHFLKQLYKNCLWLAAIKDKNVRIEEPDFQLSDMVPISGKETAEQNVLAYEKGTQSLETTVRRLNPEASEEWIEEEIARIEAGAGSDDSTSLLRGRAALSNYLDNPDSRGQADGRTDDEREADRAITAQAAAPAIDAAEPAAPLNGGQITSVLAIIEQVKNGQITEDQAIALLVEGLKLSEQTANEIIR